MRRRVKQLLIDHDAQIVPSGIVESYRQRGITVISLRYGSGEKFRHGAKAREEYTLSISQMHEGGDKIYHGKLSTAESEDDLGFMFHAVNTPLDEERLEVATIAFLLDLVADTNTNDQQWFVNPRLEGFKRAFSDYQHYVHPESRPRDVSLETPDSEAKFATPSQLNTVNLLFLIQDKTAGDTVLESSAPPEAFDDDWRKELKEVDAGTFRFEKAEDGSTRVVFVEPPRCDVRD